MPVNNTIKLRRGTDWSSNPVLAQGEPGFDTTNNILKVGDGTTAWSGLNPIGSGLDYLQSHPNISAASSSDNSGRTYIQDILLDSNGHVIGITTATETGALTETNDLSSSVTWVNVPDANITESSVIQHSGALRLTESQIVDLQNYLTSFTETNNLSSAVTWANVPDSNITQSSVVQHTGALRITESQIVDLQNYLTSHPTIGSAASSSDNSGRTYIQDILLDSNGHVIGITTATETVTDTNTEYTAGTGLSLASTEFSINPNLINSRTEVTSTDSDYLLIWDATDSQLKKVDAGEFRGGGDIVDDTTPQLGGNLDINSKNVTGAGHIDITGSGHFSSLIRADSFIKDGGTSSQFLKADGSVDSSTYLTSFTETNDLSAAVVWTNVPDANITESSVVQHTGAFRIKESQVVDLQSYLTSETFTSVVQDITPQLGGNLDLNSKDLIGAGDIDTSGNIYVSGDFRTAHSSVGHYLSISDDGGVKKIASPNSDMRLVGGGSQDTRANIQVTNTNGVKIEGESISATDITINTRHVDANIIVPTGNLGLGTDSPARKLHVVGDVEFSGTIYQSGSVFQGGGGGGSTLTEEQVEDFVGGMVTGNTETGITVTYQDADGTLDFVVASQTDENFTTADHSKLDGIEASADVTDTANVTSAGALMDSELTDLAGVKGVTISTLQVKPSEGAFADGDKTKLDAIEASADVTDTTNVTAAGALMDSEVTNLSQVKAFDSSDYATAAQGTKADSAQQPPSEGAFANGDKTKLDGIEANATADQTDEEIQDIVGAMLTSNTETGITVTYQDADGTIDFAVSSQTDENFTTADHSKLDGIEASADVTDATNVDAAGAVMNSDTSTASMSFVVDEDNMSSDSNTKVPTQQSVKAYIDGGGFLTAHPNISAASSSDNSGNTFIQDITLDSNGHVTALTTATASAGGGGGIGNVVEDTTPQLGGNLDLNSKDITGTGDIDVTGSGHFSAKVEADSFVKDGGTSSEFLKADGSVDTNTYSTTDTQLTEEQVEDFVGGMLTGNTETGITVTYQDADGTIDFVVASQTDENFTTADHSKLDGIEASADVTDTANVTSAGALMDSEVTNLSEVKAFASSDYATAAQGTKADSAQQPPSEGAFANGDKTKLDGIEASADVTDTANVTSAGALMDSELTDLAGVKGVTISTLQVKPSEGAFADGDKTKLDAIEASATADQTDEEIQDIVGGMLTGNTETGITVTYQDADGTIDFVVASQTDENFTTADHSKLDGIEASADVTDTANVTSAGALMDSELTDLAGVKGVTISTLQVKPSEGAFANGDKTKLDAIEALADVTDATNVNAAGAVMNSDSTTAGMSFVVDEDNMASDSATKVPTQQSVKAYVDANAGGGGSMTTVKGNGSQVGGADIVTLDFSDKFTVAESPDTEINIGLSTEVLSSGDLSTTLSGTTGIHIAYNSSADAIGINVDPTLISSRTEVTSADADYLLVWDATDSELKKVDAGEFRGGSTLTEEQVEDFVGGMVTGNTETFITVTYEDSDGTLDFVVPVKDEDNMASNSATHLATQQSIKAYVDANAGGGGSMTTVKGNGSQVGGADIVTLDFSSEFAVTESPDTEINIALSSEILSSGDLSTTLSGSAGISLAYDSSADAIGLNVDINGSTDLTAPAVGDELIISDASDSNSIKKADVASVVNLADHDALTNFVANEHIDHTSVTLTAGDGLTGGGDISANRTFAVSVDDSTIEINSSGLRIKDAAITPAKIGAGGFVFNEAGAAVDFRVEGDTEQNLLFVDGSADKIGIGTDSPAGLLHIKGEYSAGAHMTFEDTSSSLKTRLYNGNSASVIAVDEGDAVGTSSFQISVDNATKATFGAAATTFDQNVTINASTNQAIIGNSITVFNEGGANVDFRVEGDTDTDLLFVDASADTVQIGKLNINGAFTLPTADGSANQILKTDGNGAVSWAADGGGGGGGSMTTVKGNGSQVGGADIVTLDFASNFAVTETPDTEVNIDLSSSIATQGITATTGLIVGVSGLHHQSGTIVHSTEAAWGDFPGNAQNTINLLTGKTTNATFTSLPMNNGMYSGVKLPSNKTFFADVNIVGRRTNGGQTNKQHAAYQLKACISNDAFGRDFVGSVSKTVIAESNSAWDVQLAFAGGGSGQTDYLLVQCKGAASTNVNWVAKVDLLEVGGLNETSAYREANILSNMSPEIIP